MEAVNPISDGLNDTARWDDYRVFLAIYRCNSLTAAAKRLGVSQSTASRRLCELETALDLQLFDRTPGGLLATEVAERLLPHAEVVEQQADAIARLAAGQRAQATGRVRMALPEGLADLALVPRLPELQRKHPGLAIDLVIGPAVVDLVRREADIALRFVRPVRGDLVAKKLAELELGVFGLPELVAENPAPTSLRWILLEDREGRFPETRWHKVHVSTPPWMYTTSYTTLLAALKAGLGVGIISRRGAAALGLTELKTDLPEPASCPLYLVTHRALRKVPRVVAVWDWLEAEASALNASSTVPVPAPAPIRGK